MKDFLKPTWGKIILFGFLILIAILSFYFTVSSLRLCGLESECKQSNIHYV